MTPGRYWWAAGLSAAAIMVAAITAAVLVGLPVLGLVFGALALYAAGLLTGIVPPGRPPARGQSARWDTHETEPIWPYVVPSPQPAYTERMRYAIEEDSSDTSWAAWTLVTIVLAAGIGATAFLVVALGSGNDAPAGEPQPSEAVAGINPAATPTPQAATATPVAPTPTPTATQVPPTPTASPSPTVTSSPTRTATPTPRRSDGNGLSLTGQWLIVDVVAFGPDAGKTFSFSVTLSHDGDRITGSGDGMTLQGSLKEQVLTVTFQRPGGGEGVFVWAVLTKDLLIGDFRDHTAANGGSSTMTRIS